MRYIFSLISILVLLLVPTSTYSPVSHGPRIILKNGTSTNWSGYAALTSLANPQKNSVTDAKGSWTVPSLSCVGVTINTYSSAWVGMDGYSNSSVEQTGTEHDCINGQAQYYAWYEMYPKPSYKVPLVVHAGDVISAEVKYVGSGQFALSLSGPGGNFTTIQRDSKAQRQSAEWIVEAPWSGGVLPLANFGVLPLASSLVNGHVLGASGFAYDQINMAATDGTLKASTSALVSNTDFNVTWLHQ